MSSRLVGAILALTAAALLAASMLTSAWWSGHPVINGRTITAKEVVVGLSSAEGCNTGGDQTCESFKPAGAFRATSYVELGATSLLAIALVFLALATHRASAKRRAIAWGTIACGGFATVIAIALLAQGPKLIVEQHGSEGSRSIQVVREVPLPVGYGMILFFLGIGAAVAGSVLAMRPIPPLTPRPSRQPFAPGLAPPPHAPADALAMLPPAQPQPPYGTAPAFAPPPSSPSTPAYVPSQSSPSTPAFVPPSPTAPAFVPPSPTTSTPQAAQPPMASPGGLLPGPAGPLGPGYNPSSRPAPPSTPPRAKPATVPPPTSASKPATLPPPIRGKATSVPPPNKPRLTPPPPKPGEVLPAMLPVRNSESLDGAMTVERPRSEAHAAMSIERRRDDANGANAVARAGSETEAAVPSARAAKPAPAASGAFDSGDEIETHAVERVSADSLTAAMRPSESELATQARPKVDPSELEPPRESASELATVEHEKLSASELAAPPQRPSSPIVPVSTAPASLPPPAVEPAASSGPSPACPQCEAPMGWVEEHLRFYCKSCRMYF
ncbi:MAG TPA: hypothetical protein VM513_23845 [Kofleriaceae bacterium]|nr:hypothetical protein [Kofleriaceae bacterium]